MDEPIRPSVTPLACSLPPSFLDGRLVKVPNSFISTRLLFPHSLPSFLRLTGKKQRERTQPHTRGQQQDRGRKNTQEIRSLCCHLCFTLMDSKEGCGGVPRCLYSSENATKCPLGCHYVGKSSSREQNQYRSYMLDHDPTCSRSSHPNILSCVPRFLPRYTRYSSAWLPFSISW